MSRIIGILTLCFLLSGSGPGMRDNTYHVTGRVIDAQTSQPVVNARISILDAISNLPVIPAVYTDAQGYFDTSDFIGVDVERGPSQIPTEYRVGAAAPNPVTSSDPAVIIPYETPMARSAKPRLEVFDALGRSVPTDGPVSAGVYFYRLRFEDGFVSSSRSLVIESSGRPRFVLREEPGRISAGKGGYSSPEIDIGVEKVGYAPASARIGLTLNTVDVKDFSLTASSSFNVVMETPVVVQQTEVSNAGATLVVSDTGSPIDGLALEIPAGSYPDTRGFKIEYAPVVEHNFGPNFNPISPMIGIRDGGGYADSVLTLTIPVTIPAGDFAMAFLYDETTGKLEGLPLKAETESFITIATRHFSPITAGGTGGKRSVESVGRLLVTSMSESALNNQGIIDTGYKPGTDDWEFANYGSYIAPGGHCAGQSITAMWYYYEKKPNGQPALNGHFDTLENLQYDNPLGYRFASVIQQDIQWDGWLYQALYDAEKDLSNTPVEWNSFIYSMLLTGEPQFVGLYKEDAGHAIVAYKVAVSEGKLYVADPNYPDQIRTILFKNDKLQPYSTKQNSNEADDHAYPWIGYYAKSSMIDWDKIGTRWEEVKEKTIGSVAPNTFPEYSLIRRTETGTEGVVDRMESDVDTVAFMASCPSCVASYVNSAQRIHVYDSAGSELAFANGQDGYVVVNLVPGDNILGMYIPGFVSDGQGGYDEDFIDFRWITVHYTAQMIVTANGPDGVPISSAGRTGQLYTFTAVPAGEAPVNARFDWDFGDGSAVKSVLSDSTAQHAYTQEGTYALKVSLYDDATGVLLQENKSDILIEAVNGVSIPYSSVLEASTNIYTWAPYNTEVTGTMIIEGAGAKIDFNTADWYSLSVLKDQQATLTFNLALTPTEDYVTDDTDSNGKRTVMTYPPPYLASGSLDVSGSFPQTLAVAGNSISGTFTINTFTFSSGDYVSIVPRICYDRNEKRYDKDGVLTFDHTSSPVQCKDITPTVYIATDLAYGKTDR